MRALTWHGKNDLRVETVDDPKITNPKDVILKVTMSTTCGSDIHILDGLIPTMEPGDVIGHEFMGEVVEVGKAVTKLQKGDRVVVPSFISCGCCWYCNHNLYSCCDNTNQAIEMQQPMLGHPTAGIYGYSHGFGGYAGAHAEYIRVPHAEVGCFKVPDGLTDEQVVFLSDAAPTGYMGADFCNIQPGQTVAVWGCGGVGLMAQKAAFLLGAERVIGIDAYPERLAMARDRIGSEIIDYTQVETVLEKLQDMTGGRGPDAVIDAVGMEAEGNTPQGALDRVKQKIGTATDRGEALRSAMFACRKGGVVSVLGVYGLMDKFPMGMIVNKGLTMRSAQQHGQAYVPRLLEHVLKGELDPSFLATHRCSLEEAPQAYKNFRDKVDGCVRYVFTP